VSLQLPILVAIGSAGDLPVKMLAEALALDGSALRSPLKVLEDRGLISIAGQKDDAHVRTVSLTAEGSCVLSGAIARLQAIQHSVHAQFGRPRLQALHDELDALWDAVSE
jgi:DNA-binding MarR family transcriptional regulator